MLDELAAPHHVEHWRSRARQTESGPEWTIEEWADQVREMRRSVTRRAEEARQLMVE